MYTNFSKTYEQIQHFFFSLNVPVGITVDMEFTIFIFLLPFLKHYFVGVFFVFGELFPHHMLYFQCYLSLMILFFNRFSS